MNQQKMQNIRRPVLSAKIKNSKTGLYWNKLAFTLVELIVVITILAILGTIAFISLQGYSKDARDATRTSDLSSMKSTLELYQLDAGKYPEPTNGTIVTYTGSLTAWTQGLFGESVYRNTSKLDKVPLDPTTNKEYVYSTTATRNEYQLAAAMEGDEVALGDTLTSVSAIEKTARLKISGTYNGKLLKVMSGSTAYILAMPSIMSASGTTVEEIITNKTLAYNGYKNLPSQYTGNYNTVGETALNLVNINNVLIYSGDAGVLSKTDATGKSARKTMLDNLKAAYSGSTIKSIGEIAQILSTDTSNTGATESLTSYMVKYDLGGSIKVTSSSSSSSSSTSSSSGGPNNGCALPPAYPNATFTDGTPTSVNQGRQNTNSGNPCYYECTGGYTGNDCSVAPVVCNTGENNVNGVCVDPYWNNVKLLLHFDGTDGSTTFTDEKGHTFSRGASSSAISGTNKMFGNGSLLLNGSSYLQSGGSADWDMLTGNFTIETFVRYNNINTSWTINSPSNQYLMDIGVNGYILSWNALNGWAMTYPPSTTIFNYSGDTPVINTWYHLAYVRTGNTIKFYINGVEKHQTTYTGNFGDSNTVLTLGDYGGGEAFGINGYIDEFRITKGVARYTSNFTPPTRAFPNQ